MQQKVELQYDRTFSCIVNKGTNGKHNAAAYRSYSAHFNGEYPWYAICGDNGDRAPDQQLLHIVCSAAHNNCGNDHVCMRDYIYKTILGGIVEMCRARFNLMVTKATNFWSASGYNVKNTYDGSYANCIMYCVA